MNRRAFLFAAAVGVAALGRGRIPSVPECTSFPSAVGGPLETGGVVLVDGQWGIMRDSVLNATNDYQMFAETFDAEIARLSDAPNVYTLTTAD